MQTEQLNLGFGQNTLQSNAMSLAASSKTNELLQRIDLRKKTRQGAMTGALKQGLRAIESISSVDPDVQRTNVFVQQGHGADDSLSPQCERIDLSSESLLDWLYAEQPEKDKWVTLLAPRGHQLKSNHLRVSLCSDQLLLLSPPSPTERFFTALTMMRAGNTGLVIVWLDGLNELQKLKLEEVSMETRCRCLLVCG